MGKTMPDGYLFRDQMSAGDYHHQTLDPLAMMDPEFDHQGHANETYHEMDFTYLQPSHYTPTSISSSRLSKYPTDMEMDADSLSGLRSSRMGGGLADSGSGPASVGLNPVEFTYSQHPLNLDSTPSSLPSLCASSKEDDSICTDHSISGVGTSTDEKICPLITGETDICNPDRCGPDAPCMNFTNIPPIEECTNVPCMTAPEEDEKPPKTVKLPTAKVSKPTRQLSSDKTVPRTQHSSSSSSSRKHVGDSGRDSGAAAGVGVGSKAGAGKSDAKSRAKQAHSLVEKKYRENLNAKLLQLHDTLRMAHYGPKRHHRDMEDDNDSDDFPNGNNHNTNTNSKFRKGEVLDDALDYVNQTEVEMRHMENEIHRLVDMVGILERRLKYEDASRAGQRMMVNGPMMTVGTG